MYLKIILPIMLCAFVMLQSCNEEDEGCGSNGTVEGSCFDVSMKAYNTQTINSTPRYTRENLFLKFDFAGTNTERYALTIRSDDFEGFQAVEGESYPLQVTTYVSTTGLSFDGGSSVSGELITKLTKVDRVNGLVSGSYTFTRYNQNTSEYESSGGTFSNVEVTDPEFKTFAQ